jgi:hypothetical protein
VHVPLPLALDAPPDVPPRLPVLRRHASTLWWPLTTVCPLILVGESLPTLRVLLDLPAPVPDLLLYDLEQTLSAPDANSCLP